MLPKKNRLSRSEVEFLKKKKPPVIQGRFFGLIFWPEKNGSKFGLIVSNRMIQKSVARNQVKRQLFWAIRKVGFNKEGWFLFLAKKASRVANLKDFEEELERFRVKLAQNSNVIIE